MKSLEQKAPEGSYPKFSVMGRVFDPDQAAAYADSFAIKRSPA
jgi:nitrate/nitrite transport system substrate-binding protein